VPPRADYTVSASYSPHAIAPHAYTVHPLQPSERLAYFQVETFINTIGGAILGGVNIEIQFRIGGPEHVDHVADGDLRRDVVDAETRAGSEGQTAGSVAG
jgi:hypothetical protein